MTMSELARMADVSQATVSRVLNGSTGVSPEKKARVMEWVRKTGFQPNRTAQTLAASKSQLIGLVVPDLMNPYFAQLVAHIESIAARSGYNIIVANTDGNTFREKDILSSLKARQVDGILIAPTEPDSPIIDELKRQNPRTVIITQDHKGIDSVGVSHYKGGSLVAEHFLSRSIEEFAFFGNVYDEKYHGYRDTLVKAGIAESEILTIGREHSWWLNRLEQGFHIAEEYLKARTSTRRLGVMAMNDPFALGVIHAAQDLEMAIPTELSVMGFDDTFICQNVRPTLSSVYQPLEEISRLALELLFKRLEEKADVLEEQSILLDPRLVIREST